MPACGLRRGSRSGPARPILINTCPRPSRGAKPRGADGPKLPQRQPHQSGSRGGGEIKAGVPRKEPMTQAMTIETRQAPACAVSSFPLWCKGGNRRRGVPRHHGEALTPTSNQPPRGAQGRQLLGPAALCTCPFASLLSQVRARLGPGGYCRRSGNGGCQTCLPAACGVAQGVAQYGPFSSTHAQDPREGPGLAGRTTGGFARHNLARLAREEAERSRQGTSRGARDASHDDRD